MRVPSALVLPAIAVSTGLSLLALDLLWLGVIAKPIYDSALGPLRAETVYWPAALLFYGMYVATIVSYAVVGSTDRAAALRRGAAIGGLAYATYELTNWAVLRDWPAVLVPIDIAWGVALTAASAFAGKVVQQSLSRPGS